MIDELSIRDLGVIDDARVSLGPGFTALTGETGAGKTMVISALALLLGERGDAGAIRSGRPLASVEGRWEVDDPGPVADRVREAGGELDPTGPGRGSLILARSVSAEGRSRGVVGGRSAPIGVLTELGGNLVVVHGQADQVRLRSAVAQRDALDRFAGAGHRDLLGEFQAAFRAWQIDLADLDVLVAERERRGREAEELRSAIEEIEAVAPRRGEDVELAERAERLSNLEDLRLAAQQAHEDVTASTDDGRDAVGFIEDARRAIARAAPHDPTLTPILEALDSAAFGLSELSTQLAGYLASLDADGARELETIHERRAELGTLIRHHGPTLDDVIDLLDVGSMRLVELDGDSDRIEQLTERVEIGRNGVDALAARLTASRVEAAGRLSDAVSAELGALAMPDARVVIEVADRELGSSGRDQVTFLLRPHSGSEPRPLARGASGGELSRVMLAIEVVLAADDPVPTFVFDEIDAGVGGASAIEVGRRLARLSASAQVIVVTHLAQVAAFASRHLTVVKDSDGAVTASSVREVTGEERVAEMARLLSGLPDSESGLEHARELLEMAAGV